MLFSKKKCRNCDEKIDNNWNFCPHCGEELTEKSKNIFDEIDKHFEEVDKTLDQGIYFKPIKGISITISGDGTKPEIEVKNFGHFDHKAERAIEKIKEKPARIPKITEEPETMIEKIGNRQIVSIKLPRVKMEDIEIKRLEQSIEVKAFAGDKAYFKLIPIPSNASINRTFENDMLKIEVQR
jgi:HSP20 family molecular chaperone IbpA